MIRIIITVCFSLMFSAFATAGMNSVIPQSSIKAPSILANGTLSITVGAAPVVGLPAPKIFVMHHFVTVYQKDVNWGDTWNLTIPSGDYKIYSLPVSSNGTDFYIEKSVFAFVPSSGVVNSLITYHII